MVFELFLLPDSNINNSLHWRENMLAYLTTDIVSFGKRTVFRQRYSRKIASFEEQIISLAYKFLYRNYYYRYHCHYHYWYWYQCCCYCYY